MSVITCLRVSSFRPPGKSINYEACQLSRVYVFLVSAPTEEYSYEAFQLSRVYVFIVSAPREEYNYEAFQLPRVYVFLVSAPRGVQIMKLFNYHAFTYF
jgi:hypothetical protein